MEGLGSTGRVAFLAFFMPIPMSLNLTLYSSWSTCDNHFQQSSEMVCCGYERFSQKSKSEPIINFLFSKFVGKQPNNKINVQPRNHQLSFQLPYLAQIYEPHHCRLPWRRQLLEELSTAE